MNIEKAPIIKTNLSYIDPELKAQRDADHQYYLSEFVKWGDEYCEHAADGYSGGNNRLRRECPICWQSLQQEGKLDVPEICQDDPFETYKQIFKAGEK